MAGARELAILRSLLDDIIRQLNYHHVHIEPINSGGANFTSALYLATCTDENKEDLHLFAKVAFVGKQMRKTINATNMFRIEQMAYMQLNKVYDELQRHLSEGDRFTFPKFYGCKPEEFVETVVLEDLTKRGYESYNRLESVDWDHAASSIETLAKFHALSFAFEKQRPEEFEKARANYVFASPVRCEASKQIHMKMIGQALGVLNEKHRGMVQRFLENGGDNMYEKYNRPSARPVLIHGDYRPSNLLFKREDAKIHAMAVDFQTIHLGCPALDVVYFIFMGSDGDFRSKHYGQLVDHYYHQLGAALARLNVDIDDVYPAEQYETDMRDMLGYAILTGMMVLPVVTADPDDAPRIDGDADIQTFFLPTNKLFTSRFIEIVEDCVELRAI